MCGVVIGAVSGFSAGGVCSVLDFCFLAARVEDWVDPVVDAFWRVAAAFLLPGLVLPLPTGGVSAGGVASEISVAFLLFLVVGDVLDGFKAVSCRVNGKTL